MLMAEGGVVSSVFFYKIVQNNKLPLILLFVNSTVEGHSKECSVF